jgi:hypothetical protein
MRGVVLASVEGQGSDLRMETEIGPVLGVWRGDNPVDTGETLDVELEFPNARTWHDIESAASVGSTRSISSDPVFGTVMELFDDGILMVKIGGSIVQVELDEVPPRNPAGETVAISPDDLEIYPTGV